MPAPGNTGAGTATQDAVLDVVQRYWGHRTLRPLQAEAIAAGMGQRDSLVVLPTGGGKSLCYQVPPLVEQRLDVVISPLISLMKDQVDGLREIGYPAVALHSNLTPTQRNEAQRMLASGDCRLVFVAPERLITEGFLSMVQRMNIRAFAVDEAHCISHWGHDFRPEYRQIAMLRDRLPKASFHAFTATATPRVQEDIVKQLRLRTPTVLVGTFDRPNLVYRVLPKIDAQAQTVEVLQKHKGEAAIVYCVSRADTESLAGFLKSKGIKAIHYHAGMEPPARRAAQEQFASEEIDVVVATVAFGMGIDRSNVRCVVHAAIPKSIEHYQQETGRSGRDGLEAECVLFYSAADAMRWESLMGKSAANVEDPEEAAHVLDAQLGLLEEIRKFCTVPNCRHKQLTEYFGQSLPKDNCGACDVCLSEVEGYEDATVIAQKILSCVARTDQRFGIGHVVDVLMGGDTEMIRRCNHHQLSTHGLLKEMTKKELTALAYQLLDQGLLARTPGDRPLLQLNDASWEVMRKQRTVRLFRPKRAPGRKTRVEAESWEGVDRELFEHLRALRQTLAKQRGTPPFTVYDDATLRDLCRIRPTTSELLREVRGMGNRRIADLGPLLLETIQAFCASNNVTTDQFDGPPSTPTPTRFTKANAARDQAFEMFAKKRPLEEIAHATGRALGTVVGYLAQYLEETDSPPKDLEPWVSGTHQQRILAAIDEVGHGRAQPIFQHLNSEVSYDAIRLVVVHHHVTRSGKPEKPL